MDAATGRLRPLVEACVGVRGQGDAPTSLAQGERHLKEALSIDLSSTQKMSDMVTGQACP